VQNFKLLTCSESNAASSITGWSARNQRATSGSSVRRSLAPVTGARARVTLGVGERYGDMVECGVRERKGHTRGESKLIHSSQRSGLLTYQVSFTCVPFDVISALTIRCSARRLFVLRG
jgi:hypothetical protein